MSRSGLYPLGALLFACAMPPADAEDDLFWEHKQWRTYAEPDAGGGRLCTAMTGGDGDNMLKLIARGGEVSLQFEEQTSRGLKPFLAETDLLSFRVDSTPDARSAEIRPALGHDADGIPVATADLPAGAAAGLIAAMRGASTLTVLHARGAGESPGVIGEFSLAGFTANYLKAAEWCGVTPVLTPSP